MSTKFALVIGNSEYQDAKRSKLTASPEDVFSLAAILRDPDICGFDEAIPLIGSAAALRSIGGFFTKKNLAL